MDLAYTLSYRKSGNEDQFLKFQKKLVIVWNIVYWCVLIFGTVFNTFLQRYWRTGHYSVISKILIAV